jgi:hypothetical protein
MKTIDARGAALLVATAVLSSGMASGQRVAFHDFASEKSTAPATRTWTPSGKSCPGTNDQFIEIACGSQRSPEPEKLSLSIEEVRPNVLHIGDQFEVTVRLDNVGQTVVRVPWQTFGPDTMQVSSDGATASHQEVGLLLRLESAGKSNSVGGKVNLYANPVLGWSYVDLAPGNWVTIRLVGRVHCADDSSCKEIRPDRHAKLSARWFEYLYQRTVKNCVPSETNLTSRKIDSRPVSVALKPAYAATVER